MTERTCKCETEKPQRGEVALVVKEPPASAGDASLGPIPPSGRSLGEGNANPIQHSRQEIPGTEEPGGLQTTEPQGAGYG